MAAMTDEARGLTEAQARAALDEVGPNEPVVTAPRSVFREIARRFASPLVAILVLASVASAVVKDFINAAIVLGIVLLSMVVEFVQTHRSQRAADALKARVAPTATVLRDGSWKELPRKVLVPGDVFRLSAGDMVPADGALLAAKDLHLGEAALTGESLPVEKEPGQPVLMGSSVISGTGTARATLTGPKTAFGAIAQSLAARPPASEFERGTARFGVFILKTVLFLVLFVFVVTAVLRRDPLEALLFAVALAVGLTPEFLPMITTITLTTGAVRMAEAKVIVKNLAAMQNFGAMDVLCSDKTGTLTTGEMNLERWVDSRGATSERPLLLGSINSFFESGVDDPTDAAVLRKQRLDPLDSAVLRHDHPDVTGYVKVDEIPFDFERRRVSVVARREGDTILVTKGAPEHVIEACTRYERGTETAALDEEARRACAETFGALGREGFRVLGVAYAHCDGKATFTKADEKDLVLVGFLAFADPPRADAKATVKDLAEAGVTVKVVTGDSELVAAHLCERVGIPTADLLTGAEMDKMSDPALAHRVEAARVFARVTPRQKSRILQALRARGHVVGFLGDGINDAPSLHTADVGISVSGATDVAKDAADIILLEPSLAAVLIGVREGRRAFGNVMKYLLMGTSSNFGNMFSMAGAAVLLPFLPMLPTQILLNNFLYDIAQITIPTDHVDDDAVRRPRKWNVDLIRRFMLVIGPVSSLYDFLTFFVLIRLFHAPEALFHTGWFVESLATQTLVIFVIRTAQSPFKSRPSKALAATSLGVVALGVLLPFLPGAHVLGFVPPPIGFFAFLAGATLTYLGLVELVKRWLFRRAFA